MPAIGVSPSASDITAEIDRAVTILRAADGVRRVWFFGSQARHEGRLDSDLDFAVEGLPSVVHYSMLGELMLALHSPVDLIRWEEASDALRAEIIRQGTIVYAS